MPRRTGLVRRSFLTVTLSATLLLLGGLTIPLAAQAAPAQATPVAASSATAAQAEAVSESTSTDETANANDAAGDPCKTVTYTRFIYDAMTRATVASFSIHTYFCYNYSKVKSHSTWVTGNVTTVGGLEGWTYNGHDTIEFNCYVASGSTGSCSGNHESDQGYFQECILKVGCVGTWDPTVQEWENYKGQWFYGN